MKIDTNTMFFYVRTSFPILLFYVLSCIPLKGSAQAVVVIDSNAYIEGTHLYKENFDSMHAVYHEPKEFQLKNMAECFDSIKLLHRALSCQFNLFYSDDRHFIAFLAVHKKLTPGQIALSEAINPKLHYDVDQSHISQIQGYLRGAYGKKAASEWKDYVTYYSPAKAKGMFNADSLISLRLKLKPKAYYKGKYKYFQALFIQKNKRGFFVLNCFYDKKGERNLKKYIRGLKKMVWFKD